MVINEGKLFDVIFYYVNTSGKEKKKVNCFYQYYNPICRRYKRSKIYLTTTIVLYINGFFYFNLNTLLVVIHNPIRFELIAIEISSYCH